MSSFYPPVYDDQLPDFGDVESGASSPLSLPPVQPPPPPPSHSAPLRMFRTGGTGLGGADWLASSGPEAMSTLMGNSAQRAALSRLASAASAPSEFLVPGSEAVLGTVAPGSMADVPYEVGLARRAAQRSAEPRALALAELADRARMRRAQFETQMPLEIGEAMIKSRGAALAARERTTGQAAALETLRNLFSGLDDQYQEERGVLESSPDFQALSEAAKQARLEQLDKAFANRRLALAISAAYAAGNVPGQAVREMATNPEEELLRSIGGAGR